MRPERKHGRKERGDGAEMEWRGVEEESVFLETGWYRRPARSGGCKA